MSDKLYIDELLSRFRPSGASILIASCCNKFAKKSRKNSSPLNAIFGEKQVLQEMLAE
jgi:hypothetical protein